MSILNVIVKPERAWVAVDTAMVNQVSGQTFEGAKILPLAHANLIFAARGATAIMHNLATWCMGIDKTVHFDMLAEMLPGSIDPFHDHLMNQIRTQTGAAGDEVVEMIVVGWSKKNRHMDGLSMIRSEGVQAYKVSSLGPCRLSPSPDEDALQRLNEITVPNMTAYMTTIAGEQLKWAKENGHQGQGFGGRLLVAEIALREVLIRDAGRIDCDHQAAQ